MRAKRGTSQPKRARASKTTKAKTRPPKGDRHPRVAEVLTPNVEQVEITASIEAAARKMAAAGAGILPVFAGDILAGMLTDRDIVVRVVAAGRSPATTRVRDVMSTNPVYCYADDGVDQAARLMAEHRVRRLIVLDSRRKLAGILSITDLAARGGDDRLSGETLWSVSEPSASHT